MMLGWGLMTMLSGAVHNYAGIVAIRFFLGAFEAGLFPGLVYCLTFWYKTNERAVRIATISATATLGTSFSSTCVHECGSRYRYQAAPSVALSHSPLGT